jgi:hypothetical protein
MEMSEEERHILFKGGSKPLYFSAESSGGYFGWWTFDTQAFSNRDSIFQTVGILSGSLSSDGDVVSDLWSLSQECEYFEGWKCEELVVASHKRMRPLQEIDKEASGNNLSTILSYLEEYSCTIKSSILDHTNQSFVRTAQNILIETEDETKLKVVEYYVSELVKIFSRSSSRETKNSLNKAVIKLSFRLIQFIKTSISSENHEFKYKNDELLSSWCLIYSKMCCAFKDKSLRTSVEGFLSFLVIKKLGHASYVERIDSFLDA